MNKGCTPKSLRKNIALLVREGRPSRQAYAIAASVQRKNCKCRIARGPRGGKQLRCKSRRRR